MKKFQKMLAIVATLNGAMFGMSSDVYAMCSDKGSCSTNDVKEQFLSSARLGLDEVVNNIVVDKKDGINFRYTVHLEKDGEPREVCLKYKAKDETLHDDVTSMLRSMIFKAMEYMLEGNVILLPSLGNLKVCAASKRLNISESERDSMISELINLYVNSILDKVRGNNK